jgi:type I restriction enzyme S subunit
VSELNTYTTKDLIEQELLFIGDGYRAKNSELSILGVPFVRAGNINGSGFNFREADCFPIENLHNIGNKISASGDVVFTSKGSVGRMAFCTDDTPRFVYSPQLCFWRSLNHSKILPRFLYYWMQGQEFIAQANMVKGQTDMADYVSLTDQRRMTITLPALDDQKAIAKMLGALDDKIELNRQMNETLEAMAQAVFKSWFVDFDPVKANAEGRPLPGLDPSLQALFPVSFEPSALGDIPSGWRVGKVEDGFRVLMGQSPPGYTYNEQGDGLPFYQGRTDFMFRYPERRVYCTQPTRIAMTNDTLVSVRAPVGDVNMANEECAIGRGVAAIKHKSDSRSFTYYSMQNLKSYFDRYEAEGTVFGSISKPEFLRLPKIMPPQNVIQEFEKLVYPLDEKIEINSCEIKTLAQLRDTLLPKLLSGELRLTEAESRVEALV